MASYPQPGTVLLGKYRVDSLIGEGGMGAVVKAQHLDLDEIVAIKILLRDLLGRQDIVARFLREAKASVKLKGEHVARVLDVGRLDGEFEQVPYIVMEYLDGADLNAILKHHGPQDPAVAVDLCLQACEAIAEAHSLGIIHRDIKASNFFITQPEDQAPHLKVLDFGIATAPQGTSDLTSTQSVIGTPAYMAPEQMRSSRIADARSDIWSMGVVLYEVLEGARPFRSDVYSDLCLKVGMDPPEPMVKPVPEGLRAIVLKCLEKAVDRRYQSVAELAFDLMPFASDPVAARASVEQCAKLLGRRGNTRSVPAMRTPADATPASLTPPKLTPSGLPIPEVERTPGHSQAVRSPLTPVPPAKAQRTPTSVNSSNGEMRAVTSLRPSRRALTIASIAIAVALVMVGGVFVFSGGSSSNAPASTVAPAAAPQPAIVAPSPEPQPEPATEPAPDPEPAPVPAPVPTITVPVPSTTTIDDQKTVAKPKLKPAPVVVHKPPLKHDSDADAFSKRK